MHPGGKRNTGLKGLWQSGALLFLAVFTALVTNQIRPQKLVWIGDWSAESLNVTKDGTDLTVPLEEARTLFFSGEAVFIDARSSELYQFGHILGARSLPWEELDAYVEKVTRDLAAETTIITYCDGEACGLSRELALELEARGYRKVRVLVNGWSLWLSHELPVAVGPPVPAS